jgi:quercetin dioxygenase-like cupin family protein
MNDTNHNPIRCELEDPNAVGRQPQRREPAAPTESRIHKFRGDYKWVGIEVQPYKNQQHETNQSGDWAEAVRQVIIGTAGEPTDFHLRYFEIAAGGYTSLEKHDHAHVVIGIRGAGCVIAGPECWDVSYLDTVYISPLTPHQLINPGPEPFGFFCLVDAVRDRPQPLSETERERIMQNEAVRQVAKW